MATFTGYASPNASAQRWREVLEGRNGTTPGVPRTFDGYDSYAFSLQAIRELLSGNKGRTPGVPASVDGFDSPNFSLMRIRELLDGGGGPTPGIPQSFDGFDSPNYSLQRIREYFDGNFTHGTQDRTADGFDSPDYSWSVIGGFFDQEAYLLTVSGNEITDATRQAGLAGDGRAPDDSFGIWEATTNLISNGGFESNTTGWSAASATIERVTDGDAKFGLACLQITTALNAAGVTYVAVTAAASTVYTASFWFKAPAGKTIRFRLQQVGPGTNTDTTHVATGDWQRVTSTITTSGTTTALLLQPLQHSAGDGEFTWRIDGAQIEQQPIATPYVETNGATATRAAARVQARSTGLNPTLGWFAVRLRMGFASTQEPGASAPHIFQWADSSAERVFLYYLESDNSFRMQRQTGGAGNASPSQVVAFAAGDVFTLVGRWTATGVSLSINGAAFQTTANTEIPTIAAALFDIGSQGAIVPGREIDGLILAAAAGSGGIVSSDALAIHNLFVRNPGQLLPGMFPPTPAVKFIWKPRDAYALAVA